MNQEQDQKPNVAVIRQRRGPDIIGIIVGYKTSDDGLSTVVSSYLIEYPFVPVIDYSSGSFNLMPWCPFTDQTVFEFKSKDMVFMVPAKEELATNYLSGLGMRNAVSVTDPDQVKKDKIAFRKALETLSLAPSTETLQ